MEIKIESKSHRMRRIVLLLLATSLTSCEVNPETKCANNGPHDWSRWELTERPENFSKDFEVQRKTCKKCGYTVRESNCPK
jgi:predicted nucleic-acid-binding Zn-ribbon protein